MSKYHSSNKHDYFNQCVMHVDVGDPGYMSYTFMQKDIAAIILVLTIIAYSKELI